MNRRRAAEPAFVPPFGGVLLRRFRRLSTAFMGCALGLFAVGCVGGGADPGEPRHLTIDRPNAPFAEPDAIRGVTPLAKSAIAKLSDDAAAKVASKSSPSSRTASTRTASTGNASTRNASTPNATPTPPGVVANAIPAAPAPPTGSEIQIVGQIVRGERARGTVIAEVDVDRCFEAIPSYRNVKGDRNSRDYARYLLNLTEANEEFRSAVEGIALRDGYDLVVEKGGVRGARTVDITDAVCERLSEQKATIAR